MQPELDPLSQLRDIHLPADPHWWPPAPGWWILLFICLLLLYFLVKALIQIRNSRRPRKAALNSIMSVANTNDPAEAPLAIQSMLKTVRQFTIQEFGREMVAALHGEKWLEFLKTASGHRWVPSQEIEQALVRDQFVKSSSTNLEDLRISLLQLCRHLNRNNLSVKGQR